jgi:hypothetical protein
MEGKSVTFLRDIFLAGHQRRKDETVDAKELGVDDAKLELLLREKVVRDAGSMTAKAVTPPVTKKETAAKKKASSKRDGE